MRIVAVDIGGTAMKSGIWNVERNGNMCIRRRNSIDGACKEADPFLSGL